MIGRRTVLAALGSAALSRGAERFRGPLGIELYSLRREMAKDVPGTLATVRRLGFGEVEVPGFYNLTAAAFRKELDRAGLKATAMVAQDEALRKDLRGVADEAHTLGTEYVIYPWIPHRSETFDAEAALRASEEMNRWGGALRNANLSFCYHAHGYEFARHKGGTVFDVMAEKTDPAAVNFQLDTFWVAWAGQDPVALLNRYPRRMLLAHLKDVRKGEKGGSTGHAPEETSVALGAGAIDFRAFLRDAKKAGVKRYYIEDEAPAAAAQIPQSLQYLRNLAF